MSLIVDPVRSRTRWMRLSGHDWAANRRAPVIGTLNMVGGASNGSTRSWPVMPLSVDEAGAGPTASALAVALAPDSTACQPPWTAPPRTASGPDDAPCSSAGAALRRERRSTAQNGAPARGAGAGVR